MLVGCNIVAGSHLLGGPHTSDVENDFGCCRLGYVVMCSSYVSARTCALGALGFYFMIILAFLLRGSIFRIMGSGI